jgi:hypothetical protein
MSGPLYTFTYVTDPPDRCAYYVLAYPMRGAQSNWLIVPGTIEQDIPADEFDLEPQLMEETDGHGNN